jgi:hypothetical protein
VLDGMWTKATTGLDSENKAAHLVGAGWLGLILPDTREGIRPDCLATHGLTHQATVEESAGPAWRCSGGNVGPLETARDAESGPMHP